MKIVKIQLSKQKFDKNCVKTSHFCDGLGGDADILGILASEFESHKPNLRNLTLKLSLMQALQQYKNEGPEIISFFMLN